MIKAHLTSNGRLYIPIWNQTYGFNVNARQYTRFHTQAHTKYINHHRISGERKNSVKKSVLLLMTMFFIASWNRFNELTTLYYGNQNKITGIFKNKQIQQHWHHEWDVLNFVLLTVGRRRCRWISKSIHHRIGFATGQMWSHANIGMPYTVIMIDGRRVEFV